MCVLLFLVWYWGLVFNYWDHLALFWLVATFAERTCHIFSALTLKSESAVRLRRNIRNFKAIFSTFLFFEIHFSNRMQIWVFTLSLLFKIHFAKSHGFVQVGNFKPTSIKPDDIGVAVLTDDIHFFDRFVKNHLNFILAQTTPDEKLFYCIIFTLKNILSWVDNAECSFSYLLGVFKKLWKFTVLA